MSTPQLSYLVLVGQVQLNWYRAYIGAPYPFNARNSFSLLLSLLGDDDDPVSQWAGCGHKGADPIRAESCFVVTMSQLLAVTDSDSIELHISHPQ